MTTITIDTDRLASALASQLKSFAAGAAAPAAPRFTPGTRESVDALTKQLAGEVSTLLANKGINPNKDNTVLLVVDAR